MQHARRRHRASARTPVRRSRDGTQQVVSVRNAEFRDDDANFVPYASTCTLWLDWKTEVIEAKTSG